MNRRSFLMGLVVMEGVLLGPKTAAAAAAFFNAPERAHGAPTGSRSAPGPLAGKLFVTTSTISVRTGSGTPWTPGSGTATMLEYYDDAGTLKLRETSVTCTLRHLGTDAIASGRIVQAKLVDNQWTVDVDYC